MKKTTIFMIILCLTLCSCGSINDFEKSNDDHTSASTDHTLLNTADGDVDENTAATANGDVDKNTAATAQKDVLPNNIKIHPVDFDSLAELKSSLSKENEDAFYAKYSEMELTRAQSDALTRFVTKLQSEGISVPYIDGKAVTLRNREGYSNISLFVSDRYDLPWIWFFPKVSTGENYFIQVTYLPENILTTQKVPVASEVIKLLSPNSPNIDNLGEQHEKIYNQKIQLKDREVTALVCEYTNDNRSSITFVYGNLLVEIRSDLTVWNHQWFSTLSFGLLEES